MSRRKKPLNSANHEKRPSPWVMPLMITGIVFLILVIVLLLVSTCLYLLTTRGLLSPPESEAATTRLLLIVFSISSIIIGTACAAAVGFIPVRVFLGLQDGMNRLASGKFDTRLQLGCGHLGRDASQTFNTLAEELQNTEMLRSDFINNFSHEFKTPIVSIYGFSRLLNQGKLTPEEQADYLKIIEEESGRLSVLATNVLNLTRVENQKILTGVTDFNLSEQLRTCLLLLEKKWTEKDLQLDLNFPELNIQANEELLKEVWINLFDNAIKFSELHGELAVRLSQQDSLLQVEVENHGPAIPESDLERIFRKFYQGDQSHAQMGNGIGLAIVWRVLDLHHGTVDVQSDDFRTVFLVKLPVSQEA